MARFFLSFFLLLLLAFGAGCGGKLHRNGDSVHSGGGGAAEVAAGDEIFDDDLEDDFDDEFAEVEEKDPWEKVNRKIFRFNLFLDKIFLRPIAVGYDTITPEPLARGISNFFRNIKEPATVLNSVLQGEVGRAGRSGLRFFINATLGIGGLFDPATSVFGLARHEEDFGQTLGKWGVSTGPYVVLPVFGPRNLRDAAGDVPRWLVTDPLYQVKDDTARWTLRGLDILEARSRLLGFDAVLEEQLDPYLFIRESYRQARAAAVRDDEGDGGAPFEE